MQCVVAVQVPGAGAGARDGAGGDDRHPHPAHQLAGESELLSRHLDSGGNKNVQKNRMNDDCGRELDYRIV